MKIICTYCSKEKSTEIKPIPAIKRYRSNRIDHIHEISKKRAIPFYILSGKFGLISATESIANYDHLLKYSEVNSHAELIKKQIQKEKITAIEYYTMDVADEPNLKPYLACIQKAMNFKEITITLIDESFND